MRTAATLSIAFIFISIGIKAQIPQDQLTAYYPFYSDPNSTAEYSENILGLDPALWVGNVTPTSDRFGNENCAMAFDGELTTALYIQTSLNFDPGSTNEMSISLWLKGGSNEAGDLEILLKRNPFTGNTPPYTFALYDLNKPTMFTEESSLWAEDYELPFPSDNEWHHLVAVFESGAWKMYINNDINVTQNPYGPQVMPEAMPGETIFGDITIGENFEGALDDIRFYQKALDADEVSQLFNAESDCGVVGLIETSSELEIDLYPNPTSDQINIDLKENLVDYLEIYDAVGQLVSSVPIDPFETSNLDVSHLAEGIYSMHLFWNNEPKGEEKFMILK